MLKEYSLPLPDGHTPSRAVIFLHGLGDSGAGGLLSIGRIWQDVLRDCEFICPDAPEALEGAPPDFGGRQWFRLQQFTREEVLTGTRKAAPILNAYIDHVLATRKLAPDRMALVGFSQGTMMSLYAGPRRDKPVAGIIGYSGALVGAETLAAEKKSSPPVLLVHGMLDDVVPFAAMSQAESGLKAAGIPVETVACPGLGHSIDDTGVREGLKFLQRLWK